MGTTALFSSMLNDNLHYSLLKPELEEKSYLWKNVEHVEDWSNGDLIVPFRASRASSVKAGGLTGTTDISSNKYTRGSISGGDSRPEVWMSLIFWHKDILNHDGSVKEKSFLGSFLPDQMKDAMDMFTKTLNHNVLNAKALSQAAGGGQADGEIVVDRIERFEIGMKITFGTDGTAYYVTAVDINTSTITLSLTRGGAAADLTAEAAAVDNALIYQDGFRLNSLSNLKAILLSAANGGDANVYGVSKLLSPYTQAYNKSGSDITAANILEKLFDAYSTYRQLAKVGAAEVWLSFKHLGSVMKKLEDTKGAYKMVEGSMKVSQYGFTEIELFGPKGRLKIVAHQEMDDDVIFLIDLKSLKIHSNGGIQKHKDPEGKEFYTVRDETNGYAYVVDMLFTGDIVCSAPYRNAVLFSISY